jgi:hypothetical protein
MHATTLLMDEIKSKSFLEFNILAFLCSLFHFVVYVLA